MNIRNANLLLTGLGIAGIAALFLPFVGNISPMDASFEEDPFWKLALPFFLSMPVLAASIRWIVSGSLSRPERNVAYTIGLAIACVTLSIYWSGDWFDELGSVKGWITTFNPIAVLLLGVYLLFRKSHANRIRHFRPVMALQVPYLANALFCLIGFGTDDWFALQAGAYCVLLTVVAYLLQIILVLRPWSRQANTAAEAS